MNKLLLACLMALPAFAGELSLQSGAIRLGGGTSAAGIYSVTGGPIESRTRSTGGRYSVEGGAVALAIALQTPDAPFLNLRHQNGTLILSWKFPGSPFTLESTQSIHPPIIWSAVQAAPILANNTNTISITFGAVPVHTFFRLRK